MPTTTDQPTALTGELNRERPLFVPLKAEYFAAFWSGDKTDELRRYGPRWNERTCRVGRSVVLSLGYGRRCRLAGTVRAFKRQHGSTFGSTYRAAIQRLYGTLDVEIACIGIDISGVERSAKVGEGRERSSS